jgi:hypothetical protein
VLAVSAGVLTAGCSLRGTSTSTPAPLDRRLGRALDTSGEEPSVRETARRAYRLYARAATELDALPDATDRFLAAVRAADRGA